MKNDKHPGNLQTAFHAAMGCLEGIRAEAPELITKNMPEGWDMNRLRSFDGVQPSGKSMKDRFYKRFVTAQLKNGVDGESRQGVCIGIHGNELTLRGESGSVYACELPAHVIELNRLWGSTQKFAIKEGVRE